MQFASSGRIVVIAQWVLAVLLPAFVFLGRGFVGAELGWMAVIGVVYGWVAAQSLLGSVSAPPVFASPTIVAPAAPWMPVLIVVVATAALTAVATVVPTRLATRVTAVEALAD